MHSGRSVVILGRLFTLLRLNPARDLRQRRRPLVRRAEPAEHLGPTDLMLGEHDVVELGVLAEQPQVPPRDPLPALSD